MGEHGAVVRKWYDGGRVDGLAGANDPPAWLQVARRATVCAKPLVRAIGPRIFCLNHPARPHACRVAPHLVNIALVVRARRGLRVEPLNVRKHLIIASPLSHRLAIPPP